MALAFSAKITVDHTKCGSNDSASFPVLVSGTYAGAGGPDLRVSTSGGQCQSAAQGTSNGQTIPFDVQFFSDAALTTRLPFEIASYVATTGKIEAWVQVATLSHTTDTVFYMAWGDATASDHSAFGSGSSPFDSSYKGIWHFSNGVNDSSSDAYTLTNNGGTLSASSGEIGGGVTLSGSSQYESRATTPALLIDEPITISAWVNWTGSTEAYNCIVEQNSANSPTYAYGFFITSAGHLAVYFGNNNSTQISIDPAAGTISTGVWTLVGVTWDGTTIKTWINGNVDSSAAKAHAVWTPTQAAFYIGHSQFGAGRYLNGIVDEVRIQSTVRANTADWMKAEYNNQNSPSTFYTVTMYDAGVNAPPERQPTPPGRRSPASIPRSQLANFGAPGVSFSAITDSDSIATSDAAALAATESSVDAATLTDVAASSVAASATDGSVLAESPAIAAIETAADSSTVTDLASPPLGSYAVSDTITESDIAAAAASVSIVDGSTLSEAPGVGAAISGADTETLAESATIGATNLSGSDNVSFGESAQVVVTLVGADAMAVAEATQLAATIAALDAVGLTDAATTVTTTVATDMQSLLDTAAILAAGFSNDSAGLAESPGIAAAETDSDTESFSESSSIVITPAGATKADSDTFTLGEAATVAASIADSQALAIFELAGLVASFAVAEGLTLADLSALAVAITPLAEGLTLADLSALAAALLPVDSVGFTDAVSALTAALTLADASTLADVARIAAAFSVTDSEAFGDSAVVVTSATVVQAFGTSYAGDRAVTAVTASDRPISRVTSGDQATSTVIASDR